MTYRVTLLPATASAEITEATGGAGGHRRQVQLGRCHRGRGRYGKYGTPLPDSDLESIRKNKVALRARHHAHRLRLPQRQRGPAQGARPLCLPAPLQELQGVVTTPYRDVDIVIVRENTEDLYAGIEFEKGTPEAGRAVRFYHEELQGHPAQRRRLQHQDDLRVRQPPHRQIRLRLCPQIQAQEGHGRSPRPIS